MDRYTNNITLSFRYQFLEAFSFVLTRIMEAYVFLYDLLMSPLHFSLPSLIYYIYPHTHIPVYGGIYISFNYNYGGIGFPIQFINVSTSLQPFVTDISHMQRRLLFKIKLIGIGFPIPLYPNTSI